MGEEMGKGMEGVVHGSTAWPDLSLRAATAHAGSRPQCCTHTWTVVRRTKLTTLAKVDVPRRMSRIWDQVTDLTIRAWFCIPIHRELRVRTFDV